MALSIEVLLPLTLPIQSSNATGTIRHHAAVKVHKLFQVHISILLGYDTLSVGIQTWTF